MTPGEARLRENLDRVQGALDDALARVAALEEALFRPDARIPVEWRLTPQQVRMFGALAAANGQIVTRPALLTALYGGDWPESPKVVDVLFSGMRRKLPTGIAIETVWGRGWRLPESSRAALAAVTSEGDAAHRAASALYEAGRISRAAFCRRAEAAAGGAAEGGHAAEGGVAPHPSLRDTFSPRAGRRDGEGGASWNG